PADQRIQGLLTRPEDGLVRADIAGRGGTDQLRRDVECVELGHRASLDAARRKKVARPRPLGLVDGLTLNVDGRSPELTAGGVWMCKRADVCGRHSGALPHTSTRSHAYTSL